MELYKVDVFGFGRFENKTSMRFEGKVTAIVGPNEAGKTSFLRALEHWNHSGSFTKTGVNPDLSRGLIFSNLEEDKDRIVTCNFKLTEGDVSALEEIPEAQNVKFYKEAKTITENEEGHAQFTYELTPPVFRDKQPRQETLILINRALKSQSIDFKERYVASSEGLTLEIDLDLVINILEKIDETLELDTDIENLKKFRSIIENIFVKNTDPQYFKSLPSKLEQLIEYEQETHPSEKAKNIIKERTPRFLLFTKLDRDLESVYNFTSLDEKTDKAFVNIVKLAKLSLEDLSAAVQETPPNTTDADELLDDANKVLKNAFTAYTQSDVTVKLVLDIENLNNLKIIVTNPPNSRRKQRSIAEGSQGLKQFVALFAFLKAKSAENKENILLIDEVETHLHYDAQADLVRMLTGQLLSKKVIYTTHSLGCLPEDLGNGIRFIERDKSNNTSVIHNWFWSKDRNSPGFSSILFGMGATEMTFIPMSFTIFTEGAVDHLLLPTLMKEATEKEALGFHTAPNLSNASAIQIKGIDQEAVKTVYITDADTGGEDLRSLLLSLGIPEGRINSLGEKNTELTIEDLINTSLYAKAVNTQIQFHNPEITNHIRVSDIPLIQRAKAVDLWCNENGISRLPDKRDIAFQLLKFKTDEGFTLLANDHKERMKKLYSWADNLFYPK